MYLEKSGGMKPKPLQECQLNKSQNSVKHNKKKT